MSVASDLAAFAEAERLRKEVATLKAKVGSSETERVKAALLRHTKRGKKGTWTLLELSRELDAKVTDVEQSIEQLRGENYDILLADGVVGRLQEAPRGALRSHVGRIFEGGWVRFGLLGDNQGGNRHERLDVLATAYDHYKREGIDTVYHTGNIVDGYHPRLNGFELLPDAGSSMESQAAYIGRVYPKIAGITTYFITGECHEGWWSKREGVNVGRFLEDRFRNPENGSAGRNDLTYLGHLEADIELRTPKLGKGKRGPIMRLIHPGGGTAYAISYKTQKLAEALQGGEKPQIQAVGHFHKFDYNYAREIHNVQTGCCCDQTIFMRKNNISAHVGYLIVEALVNPDGTIQRFRPEWVPFFDQGYYKQYKTW